MDDTERKVAQVIIEAITVLDSQENGPGLEGLPKEHLQVLYYRPVANIVAAYLSISGEYLSELAHQILVADTEKKALESSSLVWLTQFLNAVPASSISAKNESISKESNVNTMTNELLPPSATEKGTHISIEATPQKQDTEEKVEKRKVEDEFLEGRRAEIAQRLIKDFLLKTPEEVFSIIKSRDDLHKEILYGAYQDRNTSRSNDEIWSKINSDDEAAIKFLAALRNKYLSPGGLVRPEYEAVGLIITGAEEVPNTFSGDIVPALKMMVGVQNEFEHVNVGDDPLSKYGHGQLPQKVKVYRSNTRTKDKTYVYVYLLVSPTVEEAKLAIKCFMTTALFRIRTLYYGGHGGYDTGDWVLVDDESNGEDIDYFSAADLKACAPTYRSIYKDVTVISHCCYSHKWLQASFVDKDNNLIFRIFPTTFFDEPTAPLLLKGADINATVFKYLPYPADSTDIRTLLPDVRVQVPQKVKPNPNLVPDGLCIRPFRVDNGDCTLVTFKEGSNQFKMLIDGGFAKKFIERCWPTIGAVGQLDVVVVTHVDNDHINGIRAYFEAVKAKHIDKPKQVWFNVPPVPKAHNRGYNQARSLYDLLRELNIQPMTIVEGQTKPFLEEKLNIKIIAPSKSNLDTYNSKPTKADGVTVNRASIAFVLETGGFKALFTGDAHIDDLEPAIQKSYKLAKAEKLIVDYMDVPHHSAKEFCYNQTSALLNKLAPKNLIISGNSSKHNHPHPDTVKYLREKEQIVYLTHWNNSIAQRLNIKKTDVQHGDTSKHYLEFKY